jgi:hypothetical protein
VILIDPPRRPGNETTSQMSVLVNIGQDKTLGFMTDGQGDLAS